MKTKKLNQVRKKIDRLDNKLLQIIKKRTELVKQVIKLKKTKRQIVDRKRINRVLKNIKKKSIKNGIDPMITRRIWKSMIWSYIDFQRKNFVKK